MAGLIALLVALDATGSAERAATVDGRPAGEPREVVRRVAEVLAGAGTFRTRTSMELASGGTRVTIRGRGAFDFAGGMGRLTLRLPPEASGADGQKPITELILPGALYMKNRGAGVPADKWLRIDTAGLSDGNLVSGGATDPIRAAELLRGAREVTYVGQRAFDGVMVRHYRGTTHIGAAAAVASPGSRAQLSAAVGGFASVTVPFDAYLDGQGRLRMVRHRFTVKGGPAEHGGTTDVASTTTLYGFGVPVRVETPPPGDIFEGKIATPQSRGEA